MPVGTGRWVCAGLPWPANGPSCPAPLLAVFATAPLPADQAVALYVQFAEAADWLPVGALGCGLSSTIVPLPCTPPATPSFALGLSLLPPGAPVPAPAPIPPAPALILDVSRRLLQSFVNYALSFAQTIQGTPCVPVRVINDWFDRTMHRAQVDPDGFLARLQSQAQE